MKATGSSPFAELPTFLLLRYSFLATTLDSGAMKLVLLFIFTTILIVALTLSAMIILVRATLYVTSLVSPLQRAFAVGVELLLGVVLLLGTVWLATHLAVRIFAPKEPQSPGGPLA